MQIWCFPPRIIVLQVKSLNRVQLFVTPWTVVYQGIHGILMFYKK